MRASIFIASAFTAVVFAQSDSSSSTDPAPQTTFTTQTDSRGVITGQPTIPGQPAVVTSQPAADTSIPDQITTQPLLQTIPAVGTGINTVTIGNPDNSTSTLTVSANNSTTLLVAKPTPSGSRTSGSGSETTATNSDGSPVATNSDGSPASTGAAATMRAVAGSLVGAGAFVAAFL
jgi:hypothetical protein